MMTNFKTTLVKHCFCGLWHSVVVFEGSEDVYAWGWNKFNQFGKGLGTSLSLWIHYRCTIDDIRRNG